jgi:hypothetical protein
MGLGHVLMFWSVSADSAATNFVCVLFSRLCAVPEKCCMSARKAVGVERWSEALSSVNWFIWQDNCLLIYVRLDGLKEYFAGINWCSRQSICLLVYILFERLRMLPGAAAPGCF